MRGGSGSGSGAIASLLLDMAQTSALLCHRLVGLLQIEAGAIYDLNSNNGSNNGNGNGSNNGGHYGSDNTDNLTSDTSNDNTLSLSTTNNTAAKRLKLIKNSRYGHCKTLKGLDPLPLAALTLLNKIKSSLSSAALIYLESERHFFDKITNISAGLRSIKNKDHHSNIISNSVKEIVTTFSFDSSYLYLPTAPDR